MSDGLETIHRLNLEALLTHQSSFPISDAEKPSNGMRISMSGVLNRAADVVGCSHRTKYLEFPLRQLLENLQHVRASSNDKEALERMKAFFTLYVNG